MVTSNDDSWLDLMRARATETVVAMGGRLVSLEVREAHARPDVESMVGFDAVVEWRTGAPCTELFVVTADESTGDTRVWRYPDDPALPGLAAAVDPQAVGTYLAVPDAHLEVVSLRPGRRAVVHVRGSGIDVHLKVVPPATAQFIAARHVVLAGAGVWVPEVVATDATRGWVVLRTLPGHTLDERLESPDLPNPTADDVLALVGSLATVRLEPTVVVPPVLSQAARNTNVISAVLPSLAERMSRVLAELGDHRPAIWQGTVHGDLHPGQLVVDADGGVSGVVDVDGAGTGDVLDDLGRMIAHVMVAAVLGRTDVQRRWRFAVEMWEASRHRVDDEQLSCRVAASVLAHASGPWRAQSETWPSDTDRLVALAEQVLDDGVATSIRSRRSP